MLRQVSRVIARKSLLSYGLILWFLATGFIPMAPAPRFYPALDRLAEEDLGLARFIGRVSNGQAGVVTGAYVPEVELAFPVLQQPNGDAGFVSRQAGTVTQFELAARHGVIGLLAHNYLAGASFSELAIGQEVNVVYGDGGVRRYRIASIRRFQALSPHDPRGDLLDLDAAAAGKASGPLSVSEVFYQIYSGSDRVVFQTCINRNGEASWGRVFTIAVPING